MAVAASPRSSQGWSAFARHAVALSLVSSLVHAATTYPAPIQFTPSRNWIGVDGQWNSFMLAVGTPAQYVDVLPSTLSQNVLVVLPQGCQAASDPSTCTALRGRVFDPANSTTWSEIGVFDISFESDLGIDSNAEYGFDTFSLVGPDGGPLGSVNGTAVGGTAEYAFYVGVLSLFPEPTYFPGNSSESHMAYLKRTLQIPSLSYGYTAGALYHTERPQASLTLGGYDEARYYPNDVKFSLSASDFSTPLSVNVTTLTTTYGSNNTNLLDAGIVANIDSTFAELWLPDYLCDRIANIFNLTYDNATDLYFVDNATRSNLLSSNPNITISLESYPTMGQSVDITLPYYAFDLTALSPYQNLSTASQHFFPIRRASISSQYTIGRVFLQEAYLLVDYERDIFKVSQINWSGSTKPAIVAVLPIEGQNSSGSSGLSGGAIAGIVIGALVGGGIIAALACFFILRHRRARSAAAAASEKAGHGDTGSSRPSNAEGYSVYHKAELDAGDGVAPHRDVFAKVAPGSFTELPSPRNVPAVEAGGEERAIYEMPGDTPKPVELAEPNQLAMTQKEKAVERERVYNGVDPVVERERSPS